MGQGQTDQVFEEFAKSQNQPILLKKGEYHQLIEFMDIEDIPGEVTEKLDLIVDLNPPSKNNENLLEVTGCGYKKEKGQAKYKK